MHDQVVHVTERTGTLSRSRLELVPSGIDGVLGVGEPSNNLVERTGPERPAAHEARSPHGWTTDRTQGHVVFGVS